MAGQMFYSLLWLSLASLTLSFDPYLMGPYWTSRLDVRRLTSVGLSQNLNVWSPVGPGNFPILFMLDGFGAIIPGQAYDDVMNHISSHGYIVVNAWRILGSFDYDVKASEFSETIDWCKQHLETKLHNNNVSISMTIDYSLSFGMCHSAGCHVLIDYLSSGCNDFKGMILSSPVDTPEPTNCITKGSTLNFTMPTIVLPAGLDNVPGPLAPIPCGPAILSNQIFWDALDPESPRWMVNATEYGHADYLNQKVVNLVIEAGFCSVKSDWTLNDFVIYRDFVAGQAVSFLKSLLEDDCETYLTFIEDFGYMPVVATGQSVRVVTSCPRASCDLATIPKPLI